MDGIDIQKVHIRGNLIMKFLIKKNLVLKQIFDRQFVKETMIIRIHIHSMPTFARVNW